MSTLFFGDTQDMKLSFFCTWNTSLEVFIGELQPCLLIQMPLHFQWFGSFGRLLRIEKEKLAIKLFFFVLPFIAGCCNMVGHQTKVTDFHYNVHICRCSAFLYRAIRPVSSINGQAADEQTCPTDSSKKICSSKMTFFERRSISKLVFSLKN